MRLHQRRILTTNSMPQPKEPYDACDVCKGENLKMIGDEEYNDEWFCEDCNQPCARILVTDAPQPKEPFDWRDIEKFSDWIIKESLKRSTGRELHCRDIAAVANRLIAAELTAQRERLRAAVEHWSKGGSQCVNERHCGCSNAALAAFDKAADV